MPLTEPPEATAPLKTLNSESAATPETSLLVDGLLGEPLDDLCEELLDEAEDLVLGGVAHLEVELGVLGLAVAALVLVSQGSSYLEVPLETGDHQELLELLGGLGQRVELPGVEAGRDQVVARAFGGRGREQRGLYLDKVAAIQKVPHVLDDPVAEEDVVAHLLAAQVEVAVLQAQGLVHGTVALDLERRGL